MSETHPGEEKLLARRLVPHRSLTLRQTRLLLAIFAAACVLSSLPFFLLGAWPVAGFFGLDVILLWVAFRISHRSARGYEDVLVTPLDLQIAKVDPSGARREWHFSPGFVRLESRRIEDFGLTRLDIVSRGRRLEVADCLGPADKEGFARDLERALVIARRGPRFS